MTPIALNDSSITPILETSTINTIAITPEEMRLRMVRELLFETRSFLVRTPWTFDLNDPSASQSLIPNEDVAHIVVDPLSMDPLIPVDSCEDPSSIWPNVRTALGLSKGRPYALTIDLDCTFFMQTHAFERFVTRKHITSFMSMICQAGVERITELVIRCSVWSHLETILTTFAERSAPMPMLTRYCVSYSSKEVDNLGMLYVPSDQHDTNSIILAPKGPDVDRSDYDGHPLLPSLKHVHLDYIPNQWTLFMPTSLTSLYLHNVPRGNRPTPEELAKILFNSQYTLTTLELGVGAIPLDPYSDTVCLPKLISLSVRFVVCWELTSLARTLELPSLTNLSFEDYWNKVDMFTQNIKTADRMDSEYREIFREETVYAYEAVIENWPLFSVTRLRMEYPIFYETEANRISLLEQSSRSPVVWEENGGVPVASLFFSEFEALEEMVLVRPDDTTTKALMNQPYLYSDETGAFEPWFERWLPSLQTYKLS
ncbi:hypothetical protein PM082_014528 [Marasmius tenuissimus]|nr:hypothetical protein PM082_014528 [Marasmius tenuissimus]